MNPDVTFWEILFAASLRDARRWAEDLLDWMSATGRGPTYYDRSYVLAYCKNTIRS